jgi:hypothetical protein
LKEGKSKGKEKKEEDAKRKGEKLTRQKLRKASAK